MASTGKLLLLATVGGIAVILGTVALGLTLLLNQKKNLKLKNVKINGFYNNNAKNTASSSNPSTIPKNKFLNDYRKMSDDTTSNITSAEGYFNIAIDIFESANLYPLGAHFVNENDIQHFDVFDMNTYYESKSRNYGSGGSSGDSFSSFFLSQVNKWRNSLGGGGSASVKSNNILKNTNKRSRKRKNSREMEDLAWSYIEKAADLGHPDAQFILGNAYVSGVFYPSSKETASSMANGGRNLSLGLSLWHMAAMGGSLEAAVNLGFRYYSSSSSSASPSTAASSSSQGNPSKKSSEEDYGIAIPAGKRCEIAKAYYEEAAHKVMDQLEQGFGRGKVHPALDRHKLSEIFVAGASSGLAGYNKPDELAEALEYYRLRALSVNPSQPTAMDIHAALTLAQFHHYGLRGVSQDLKQALRYYEIAADGGNMEAAGQAGKFHLFGLGYDELTIDANDTLVSSDYENQTHPIKFGDLQKAHKYLYKATSGGINECIRKSKEESKKRRQKKNNDYDSSDDSSDDENDDEACDAEGLNGMGFLHLFGVPSDKIIKDRDLARRYFQLARDSGSVDAMFHSALMNLGWMKEWYSPAEAHENDIDTQEQEENTEEDNNREQDSEETTNDDNSSPAIDPENGDSLTIAEAVQGKTLQDFSWTDANGNPIPEDEIAHFFGQDQLNGVFDGADLTQLIQGGEEIRVVADGDVDGALEGLNDDVRAQIKDILKNIAVAGAAGAGKVLPETDNEINEVDDSNVETGGDSTDVSTKDGLKVKTQVIYADLRSIRKDHDPKQKYQRNNGTPTKADYDRAVHDLSSAASNRHIQAAHRLATIYSHGIKNPSNSQQYYIQKNCQASLKLFKQVTDSAPYVSRRSRTAYKQYMSGDINNALRNYFALAEGGNEVAQLNSAWLLEQGYCLHMSNRNCLRASLRMWRAAARQGSSEACLRVGDFYYYGRMTIAEQQHGKKNRNISSKKYDYVNVSPYETWYMTIYRWILYPEQLFREAKDNLVQIIKDVIRKRINRAKGNIDVTKQHCVENEQDETCKNWNFKESEAIESKENAEPFDVKYKQEDMATAALYYRKAAAQTSSSPSNARANFNLGFMHEWGLGLKQDFPLAKRHYDLASSSHKDAYVVVQMALHVMTMHENFVKLRKYYETLWDEKESSSSSIGNSANGHTKGRSQRNKEEKMKGKAKKSGKMKIILRHLVFSWEFPVLVILLVIFSKLVKTLRSRNEQ